MSIADGKDEDERIAVYESSQGRHPDGARDCSDEYLPEGERIGDEERARLKANPRFRADWDGALRASPER